MKSCHFRKNTCFSAKSLLLPRFLSTYSNPFAIEPFRYRADLNVDQRFSRNFFDFQLRYRAVSLQSRSAHFNYTQNFKATKATTIKAGLFTASDAFDLQSLMPKDTNSYFSLSENLLHFFFGCALKSIASFSFSEIYPQPSRPGIKMI